MATLALTRLQAQPRLRFYECEFSASLEIGETNDDGTHKRPFLSVGRDVGQRLLFRRALTATGSLRRSAIRPWALRF